MCYLNLDCAKVWNEAPRIARKEHMCDACCAAIPKGAAYLHHSSLYDGHWTTEAMCFPCWWVRATFAEAHGQTCAPGMLMETLRECVRSASPATWRRDRPTLWAPELTSVLRRYRTSEVARQGLRRRWAQKSARRAQLSVARSDN